LWKDISSQQLLVTDSVRIVSTIFLWQLLALELINVAGKAVLSVKPKNTIYSDSSGIPDFAPLAISPAPS
jgi:hypothetical protein